MTARAQFFDNFTTAKFVAADKMGRIKIRQNEDAHPWSINGGRSPAAYRRCLQRRTPWATHRDIS